MYEILAPVDTNTERALAQARTVAELPLPDDVRVILFHVFTDNPEGASVHQIEAVRAAQEHLSEAGIDVSLDEASGDPVEETLDYATEQDVDLICLAGRKRTAAGKLLFGSVSQSVLLESDRPVVFCTAQE